MDRSEQLKLTMLSRSVEDMKSELKKLYMRRTDLMKEIDELGNLLRKVQYRFGGRIGTSCGTGGRARPRAWLRREASPKMMMWRTAGR